MTKRADLIRDLLRSSDPSIRWRTRVRALGESRTSPPIVRLEEEIRHSPRVRALLSHQNAPNRSGALRSVYYYWQGIHWVLASLVELGYPRRDPALRPLAERVLAAWLRPYYLHSVCSAGGAGELHGAGVPVIRGRARRCASQQGNALYYLSRLGLLDERATKLAELLRRWQWPDGGWNCDRRPEADTSSFMETLLPMRGLAAFAKVRNDATARVASRRAAGIFLERRLHRRRSDGKEISPDFLQLHYPLYWHYDLLGGLKGMAEVGRIRDPRCSEGLDWLERQELRRGGWPADAKYYRTSKQFHWGCEFVSWGSPGKRPRNEWVTTDALFVLKEAGRLEA